jgi:hypothetical protein
MASGDLAGTVSAEQFLPSAVFDGVDDYIDVPHKDRLLGTNLTDGFTFSCWVKLRSSGEGSAAGSGQVMSKAVLENGFQFTCRQDSGKMQFWIKTTNKLQETTAIALNTWVHYLVTVSGAATALGNLYKNGVLGSTANVNMGQSVALITNTSAMRIGNGQAQTTTTCDGQIAKVRMWNRILSAAEITNDYEGKLNTDRLLFNYELNGNAFDSSQFANDGTTSGAYFTNVDFNNVIADVRAVNLAAVTDKLLVLPMYGRNGRVSVISANRTA